MSCECLGCLFWFGLISLSLFVTFIFIIIVFIKNKFVTKNIILSIVLLIFTIGLIGEVHMGTCLSRNWQEFNQSDSCLDVGGAWNYEGNYCVMSPEIIETAIRYMAYGDNKLLEGCVIKKTSTPNHRVVASSKNNQIDCGLYVQLQDNSMTRYFTVLNNFVLAFMDEPRGGLVDFNSVEVYTIE